jgi:glycosyltransferase involved in cell wall biosynthesis
MIPENASYTALIRTTDFSPTLQRVIEALHQQSTPPKEIVFVDSSGDERVASRLRKIGRVVKYSESVFNYSSALNDGIRAVQTPYTLIISSHFMLESKSLIERGIDKANKVGAEIVYWCFAGSGIERSFLIDKESFNGRNGLSNACAFIPTTLIVERGFRPEVFSAEDQEWSVWYLHKKMGCMLRVESKLAYTLNKSVNHPQKIINEEIAIAYFVNRRDLFLDRIASRFGRSLLAFVRGRKERAKMHLAIAIGLIDANFRQPSGSSKYV